MALNDGIASGNMTAVNPHTFVILGGTGDLARRKLLPALHRLAQQGILPAECVLLGVGRDDGMDDAGYRALVCQAIGAHGGSAGPETDAWIARCMHYLSFGRDASPERYRLLAERIQQIERERGLPPNRLFYLALPPDGFPQAIENLGAARLAKSDGWTRVVVEKPFGRDLASARDLNRLLHSSFGEEQIYRIDHYLGKETVQNLLVFRFANPIFESLWSRDHVDHVQITVAETLGIEGRAGYYEQAGALRDMVQNHLTQLLTPTAMEIPAAFDADAIRDEKVKVLRSVRPPFPDDLVRGQYGQGFVDSMAVPSYREEPGIADDSQTETFAALRLEIANWRWQGVPFYLRTGKRLPRHTTEVAIVFKCPPVSVFQPFDSCTIHSNVLRVRLQPDEGFDLCFEVKTPKRPLTLETSSLRFGYAEAFQEPLPDGYETLLTDVLRGDQTLFVRADEVEASWRLYAPLLEEPGPVHEYPSGTWGPRKADALLTRDGRAWWTGALSKTES